MVFEYQLLVFLTVVIAIGFIYDNLWRRAKFNKKQYELNRREFILKQDIGKIIADRYDCSPTYLNCISYQEDEEQVLAIIVERKNSKVLYETTYVKEDGTVIVRRYVRDDKTIVSKH